MNIRHIALLIASASLLAACGKEPAVQTSAAPSPAAIAAVNDGMPPLAKKHTCDACHAITVKKTGPAWMEVSKKYKGNPEAAAYLLGKVRKGGSGVWGEVPMPPNISPSDAELNELVTFVLGLAK